MKQLTSWAARASFLVLLAALLIGCGAATVAQSQSGTTGDARQGESSGLDQQLLQQVDAQIASARAAGQDVAAAQQLRDSAAQLARQGSYDEANGNLKTAALQLGVLRDAGGEIARPAAALPEPRPAQVPASAGPALLRATFGDTAALAGWQPVGPAIPTGRPLWEVQNGTLAQRGVDGVDALDVPAGLVTGDPQWRDVTVQVDALTRDTKEVGLIVRQQGESYYRFRALAVGSDAGAANLILERVVDGQATQLAAFDGPALSADAWHTLALSAAGSTISCFVDGQKVGSADDGTLAAGRVGVSTVAMSGAYFTNLQVYGR